MKRTAAPLAIAACVLPCSAFVGPAASTPPFLTRASSLEAGCRRFLLRDRRRRSGRTRAHRSVVLASSFAGDAEGRPASPAALVTGIPPSSEDEAADLAGALRTAGFGTVEFEGSVDFPASCPPTSFRYIHSKATGMLKLVGAPPGSNGTVFDAPRWIPIVQGEENVLVANGWSFLDPDESEPMSAFDVDAANAEGLYRPKWGQTEGCGNAEGGGFRLSSIGFDIRPMSTDEVLAEADAALFSASAKDGGVVDPRSVLLDGATDPPNVKVTNDGWNFSGRAGQQDIPRGVFACAVGGLPLFTTADLSPTTASSGWLSFARPASDDHVVLVRPEEGSDDRRVEVVCARSRCHLGHYFGRGEGYCINASALNFIPAPAAVAATEGQRIVGAAAAASGTGAPPKSRPLSWHALEYPDELSPSDRTLRDAVLPPLANLRTAVLGAGCFWHVEAALRRLPGVVSTSAGYAGGTVPSPTYERVCKSPTGHAEVVRVTFDGDVFPPRVLFDCFLAMHDPTKVRAHGKHARGTGQYRSTVFVDGPEMERAAAEALEDCRSQLGRELSTEVRLMWDEEVGGRWFWIAESRHQRHDERNVGNCGAEETATLSVHDWLREYARRSASVIDSGETVRVAPNEPGDDGMAMVMI